MKYFFLFQAGAEMNLYALKIKCFFQIAVFALVFNSFSYTSSTQILKDSSRKTFRQMLCQMYIDGKNNLTKDGLVTFANVSQAFIIIGMIRVVCEQHKFMGSSFSVVNMFNLLVVNLVLLAKREKKTDWLQRVMPHYRNLVCGERYLHLFAYHLTNDILLPLKVNMLPIAFFEFCRLFPFMMYVLHVHVQTWAMERAAEKSRLSQK